jgi:hypothetical protein
MASYKEAATRFDGRALKSSLIFGWNLNAYNVPGLDDVPVICVPSVR